jgi:hypothetical protein
MYASHIIKRVFQLGSRYPLQVARLRVGIGVWLLCVSAVLYAAGQAGTWGWVLPVIAVLHFGLAHRLYRVADHQRDRRAMFR